MARNVFRVPTADQRRQRAPTQPHLPGPTAAAQQLLLEASRPRRENRFCGTDLLITMSIHIEKDVAPPDVPNYDFSLVGVVFFAG
jgi:hypothetical protein